MPTLIGSADLTIIDVKDGLTAKLSNESHNVPTDENGNNGDYTNCVSTISIFIGSIDDTSNWAIQAVPSVGVNGSLINKTYTVTSMSNDVGTVDFVATKLGYPEIILRFTITKAKAGVTGSDGKNALQISIVAVQYDYRADDALWGIRINDELQPTSSRGHKLVVLDPITNTVSINQNYDTYASLTNADNLATAINNVVDGQIVLLTTWDASQCNQNLRNALKLCGSDSNETWTAQRKSHAFIGQKGLPIGAAYEKTGSGATAAGTSRVAAYYTTSGIVRNGSTAFNAVSAVLSNEAHIFQASNLGVVSSYAGSGTEIRVYDGTSLLSYDGVGTSTGTWKITTSTSNITVGTITDSGDFATVGNHSSVSNNVDDSLITYTITGKSLANSNFTLVKVQSFTKAKAGVDAISAVLSNEAHTLQASNLGVVSSYDGSGTEIRVYDGATLLSYDGIGTATGTWKITTSTSNITVGTITDSGDFATVGNHSNMNADIAGVSYFITGKTKLGNSFSLTKTQSFAKSKTGDKGDKGDTGNTGTRGTLSVSRAISGATWTDSEALLAITAMGAEAPLPGDVVTLYNIAASFSQTRVRAASSWNVLAAFYSGDVIIDNTLSADKITSNSITATKIATDAITADKISANAITATKIATDAITADKISANAITATKIATDAITADKISANAITTDKISANAITATKLNIGDTSNAFPDPTLAEASLTTWEILEGATADFSISNTGAGISFSEKTITILGGKASQISIQSPATRVEPNSEYFISAWCGAVDNGGFTTNSTGQLYARWFDSTGTFISETLVGQTSVTLSSQTTPSISGVVVAPNSAVTVKLKFTRLAGASNDAARFTAPTIRRAVNGSLIVNGAITADAISAGAITANKLSADAITADAISAGAITTDKLSAGAITTDKLSAGAITADKLSILSKEYVNPASTTKNLIGWVLNDDGSGTVPSNVSYDSIENGILLTSNANHSIRSKSWEINHSKIYRVSFKIKSSDTGGAYYVGIAASTAAMTFGVSTTSSQGTSSVIPYSTSRISSSATTNPYFYSGNKSTSYVDFVCFIIGANRDINECPLHIAPGGTPFLKVDSAATHVALRFLNWSNSTVSRSMWIKDIAVTELGSGIITAENISAGAITADKISAGAITADKISAGAITADNIDSRGLTIRDSEGNIILSAGSSLQNQINPYESGATRNVFRGNWATATSYSIGDIVLESGYGWSCIQDHISSASIKPPTYPTTANTYWTAYAIKGDAGSDGLTVVVSNESHTMPASSAGVVSSYTGSGTTIQVYEGTTALSAVSSITGNGQFTIGTPTQSPTSTITVGPRSYASSTATVASHSAMANGTSSVVITYPISIRRANGTNVTINKFQTITKSLAGEAGATGATGSQGPAGPAVVVTANRPLTFTSTDGTLDGSQSSIVLTAAVNGITSPTYVWTFSGLQTNPTASTTSSQTITSAQFGTSKSATVTCTVSGSYSDQVTIVRLEASTSDPFATTDSNLIYDSTFDKHNNGKTGYWIGLNGTGRSEIATAYGETALGAGLRIYGTGVENNAYTSDKAMWSARNGDRLYFYARVFVDSTFTAGSLILAIRQHNAAGTYISQVTSTLATSASTKDSWFDVRGSITLTAAEVSQARLRLYTNTAATTGFVQVDKVFIGRSELGATKNSVWRQTADPVDTTTNVVTEGDIWIDTSVTPNVERIRVGTAWQVAATVGATFTTGNPGSVTGQITSSNASTYIANAAIGSAQIGQLKAANIEAGAISTEKLQIGSASAVNIFSSSSNALMPWGNIEAKSVQSGNVSNNAIFTTSGGNVSVAGFVRLRLYNATLPSTVANVAIATEIYFDDVYQGMGGWSTCPRLTVGSTAFSGPIIVAPFNAIFTDVPAGTHNIKIVLYVEMINSSGARQEIQPNPSVLSSIHCSMNIIEHKV